MKKEYQLILNTVLKNKTKEEQDKIDALLKEELDWCEISGQLINHRLAGYFYCALSNEQKKRIPKELAKVLKFLCEQQEVILHEKYDEYKNISEKLEEAGIRYCGLKGLIFCLDMYDFGERRSNDLDIMVYEEDLGKLDTEMRKMGYIQSLMPNNQLVEATKKEKLIQRMNYHDLIPYMKMIGGKLFELDINFKFDSNKNNIDKEIFDYGLNEYEKCGYKSKGLPFVTHLLFLCVHFYREGTNTLWTEIKNDVLLYKIVDIVNWIRIHNDEFDVNEFCELARKFHLDEKCYFTFEILSQFYEFDKIIQVKEQIKPENTDFMDTIVVEGENRKIKRTRSFLDEAFDWRI